MMKKSLLFAIMLTTALIASAQYPTTVTNSSNCTVFRNFNLTDEGFSSPSIYSDGNDVSFNWVMASGAEVESSGLSIRNNSLISPVYVQTDPGVATIGFKYAAPAGTQYRVRIISGALSGPLEILASSANGPVFTPLPSTAGNICLLFTDADLTVGRQVRFEFTFKLNQPGDVTFDDLALSVSGGPLPVTFEGFVARKNTDGTIKLLWNVGHEVNVKGYVVESSSNGLDFTNLGYVTATGKAIYSLDYNAKPVQTMFFRVKNVDFDGNSKYTPVIKVYNADVLNAQIQVYPVPAKQLATVQHPQSPEKAIITLMTIDGKILQQINVAPNSYQTQVNVEKLSTGLYIVRYDNGLGNIQSAKLIRN